MVMHPIPVGMRDVLPDEMRELHEIRTRLREVYESAGYGEVHTPVLEYEDVLRSGDERLAAGGFRTFDDDGRVLVMRSDMTIPIARLVATRFTAHDPDGLRLCYSGYAYRTVSRGTGRQREVLQSGVELVGVDGAQGEAEVIELALRALDAVGLRRHRIGLGDGALYRTIFDALDLPEQARGPVLAALARRNMVDLEQAIAGLDVPADARARLARLPGLRGGPEVLDAANGESALDGLRELHSELERRGIADRVILDLGLVRELGYYTGAVYEVYDPAVGFTIGGGGRYDDLIGRFGEPRSACGMALDIPRLHHAQASEEGAVS